MSAAEQERPRPPGRSLKTARAVLQVLRMLEQRPEGMTSQEVAELLGKSPATASYLLNSLQQEGFAAYDRRRGRFVLAGTPEPLRAAGTPPSRRAGRSPETDRGDVRSPASHDRLREAVEEVYDLTRHRSYLATAEPASDRIVVQEMCGHQGLPTVPGLAPVIRDEAHGLALGKVLLAQRPDALDAYVDRYGLEQFTSRTITDRGELAEELEVVRRLGYAVDREEYAEGIWCLAVPVYNPSGEVGAALAVSLTRAQVARQQRSLVEALGLVAQEVGSAADGSVPSR